MKNLPFNFKVGQQVEAKSFEEGFRGAWFRCKIKGCGNKCKEPTVRLDYLDYEDYKNHWINLYEYHQFPAETHTDSENRHLMLRPSYPQIYPKNHGTSEILETVGVVDGTWEVGDMVDWFNKGCYWSARITAVLDEEHVKVQLPEPPMGEGETYKAPCKDLRPSLDWTPKLGWTLPVFEVAENFRRCVRLIPPKSTGNVRENDGGSSETSSYLSSHTSAGSMPQEFPIDFSARDLLENCSSNLQNKQKTDDTSTTKTDGAEEGSWSGSVSSPHGYSCETVLERGYLVPSSRDLSDSCDSTKMTRKSETELNSSRPSDTIDSCIVGLQKLVDRVKRLNNLINSS